MSYVLPSRCHHDYARKNDTRCGFMGLIMNTDIKKYHIIAAVFVFIILPIGLFEFGDFPRRSNLKEAISLLTVLAFYLMMSQFFLARSNYDCIKFFKFSRVLSVHKFTGYSVVGFFLIHPFLIVLPRFFEAGVSPLDAFIQILTTFENLGVILGLISWGLIFLLGVTSIFRNKFKMNYTTWKVLHGFLSILFITTASWHAIELGRHTDGVISAFIVLLAITGSSLLIKQYTSPSKTASLVTIGGKINE